MLHPLHPLVGISVINFKYKLDSFLPGYLGFEKEIVSILKGDEKNMKMGDRKQIKILRAKKVTFFDLKKNR